MVIQMNGWAVAFHGTSEKAVENIWQKGEKFFSTVEEGATGQKCCDYINVNKYSQKEYYTCGEGTYVSPHLNISQSYSGGVIIMCRVNPKKMRIPQGYEDSEWITDGTRNTIRPYRLLFNLNK